MPQTRPALLFVLALANCLFSTVPANAESDPGFVAYRKNCSSCHLDSAWGNSSIDCPSIAALPRWYVSRQLRAFRSGQRGLHPEDEQGRMMTTATMKLSEADIASLGRYVASLAANPDRKTTNEFDPERGAALYGERCAACHGPSAKGDPKAKAPPLDLQPDWYLLSQMWKFNIDARSHSKERTIEIGVAREAGDIAAYLASLSHDSGN